MANDTDKPPPRGARRPEDWSPDERLRVVRETAGLMGSGSACTCAGEGLHEATVTEWREQALAALGGSRARTKEQQRIRGLEREANRKDKALAEPAALLVLAKKSTRSGGGDDDTSGRRGK
ncbi:MAG: transposase [Sandaracinaceae bacterium]|nr:transposase [Sandaracinaceae bacterium]